MVRNVENVRSGGTRKGMDIDENEGELPLILLIRLRWLIQKRVAKSRKMGSD